MFIFYGKIYSVFFIIFFWMISIIPVSANNRFFGVEIEYVVEILTQKEFFIVPKVPDFTIGLVNIRGEIVPVFDLSTILFGITRKFNNSVLQNVILCKVLEKRFCLFVDKISKVIYSEEKNVKTYAENVWKDVRFIKFFVDFSELGGLVGILDMDNIVRYIEKTNVEFYRFVRR